MYVCEPSPDEDDEDDGIVKEVLESQRMYDTSDFEVCMYTCTYIDGRFLCMYVCLYVCMYVYYQVSLRRVGHDDGGGDEGVCVCMYL